MYHLLSSTLSYRHRFLRIESASVRVGSAPRAAAIQRMLELGAIRASYLTLTPEQYEGLKESTAADILAYECTEFGRAVFAESIRRMGIQSPNMMAVLEEEFQNKNAE